MTEKISEPLCSCLRASFFNQSNLRCSFLAYLSLLKCSFDIVCFSETWLNECGRGPSEEECQGRYQHSGGGGRGGPVELPEGSEEAEHRRACVQTISGRWS